jgi:hypothetical protein
VDFADIVLSNPATIDKKDVQSPLITENSFFIRESVFREFFKYGKDKLKLFGQKLNFVFSFRPGPIYDSAGDDSKTDGNLDPLRPVFLGHGFVEAGSSAWPLNRPVSREHICNHFIFLRGVASVSLDH